jgi:cytolysin-activating lysine-acyltransferase
MVALDDAFEEASMSEQSTAERPQSTNRRAEIPVRELKAAYRSAAFGDIVGILMRSPRHKQMPLETLRVFVVPAIANQQFLIAKVKPQGNPNAGAAPAGVALWARVSEEVDRRLREGSNETQRLKPDEWASGNILWLVDLIAPTPLVPGMLRDLDQKVARGLPMHVQLRTKDGPAQIGTLSDIAAASGRT